VAPSMRDRASISAPGGPAEDLRTPPVDDAGPPRVAVGDDLVRAEDPPGYAAADEKTADPPGPLPRRRRPLWRPGRSWPRLLPRARGGPHADGPEPPPARAGRPGGDAQPVRVDMRTVISSATEVGTM
jgi:hypothetical protein